jgi:hypothetical protein
MLNRTIAAVGLSLGVMLSAVRVSSAAPTGQEASAKLVNPALAKAVLEFRRKMTDAGGALAFEDISAARAALREAGTQLGNIRLYSRLDVIRRLVSPLLGATAVGANSAANLDKLAAELERHADKDAAAIAQEHLGKAREALTRKDAVGVRENAQAVLDSLIEPNIGIPLVRWVSALTRTESIMTSSRTASVKAGEGLAALADVQPESTYKAVAFREQLRKIDGVVAAAAAQFERGYNRDATATLTRADGLLDIALRIAPDDSARNAAGTLRERFRRCLDMLNNWTQVTVIGGRTQTLTGFRELTETRSLLAEMIKQYTPKFD